MMKIIPNINVAYQRDGGEGGEGAEMHTGSAMVSEPLGQKLLWATLLMLGYQILPMMIKQCQKNMNGMSCLEMQFKSLNKFLSDETEEIEA